MKLFTLRNSAIGLAFMAVAAPAAYVIDTLTDDMRNLSTVRKAFRLNQKIVTLEDGKQYGIFGWGDKPCKTVSAHRVLTMDINKNPLSFSTGGLYPSKICL